MLYVSIDRPLEAYGYGPGTDTTGIVERLPLAAVRDALAVIRPGEDVRQLVTWVEEHARPLLIGLHAGFVFDGGGQAVSPPPVATGRLAMGLAFQLLDSPSGTVVGLPRQPCRFPWL